MKRLLATRSDWALTLVRVSMGLVMFPHGAQKALGWFGGAGFSGTMDLFTQKMGIPAPLAFLAIAAEFLGSLGLIFGGLTRVAAFGLLTTMLVAALKVALPNGFFMNWFGNQKGEGVEFFILTFGLTVVSLVFGGGAFSLDRWVLRERKAAGSRASVALAS